MHSCTWMNGQYRGSSQAAPQHSQDAVRSQPTESENNAGQYREVSAAVQTPQRAHFIPREGDYSHKLTPAWQGKAVPHQASAEKNNDYYLKVPHGSLQGPPANLQRGNPQSQMIYGVRLAPPKGPYQNSAHYSAPRGQPDAMKPNTTCSQREMPAQWSQPMKVFVRQSPKLQDGNMGDLQRCRIQKTMYQNVKRESEPILAYTTASTQHLSKQEVCNRPPLPPAPPQRMQPPCEQFRHTRPQVAFYSPAPPPRGTMGPPQPYRPSMPAKAPPSGHVVRLANMSQKPQQYPPQLIQPPNGGEQPPTSSVNSNSHSCQFQRKTQLPANPPAAVEEQIIHQQMNPRLTDYLRKTLTSGSDGRPPVPPPEHNVMYRRLPEAEQRIVESNQPMKQGKPAAMENYIPVVPHSVPSPPKASQNLKQPEIIHIVDDPPQPSPRPKEIIRVEGDMRGHVVKPANGFFRPPNRVSNDMLSDIKEFSVKPLPVNASVQSQLKHVAVKQLRSFRILRDNEVYSERPYKSSWLNTNEQLDDIDKEFGFSWSLRHNLHTLESDIKPEAVAKVESVPAPSDSEEQNKLAAQGQPQAADSEEDKQAASTQAAPSSDTEASDCADPYLSFGIKVLPPEEAKVIFDEVNSKVAKPAETDSPPQTLEVNGSAEHVQRYIRERSLNPLMGTVPLIEQVCCLTKWLEIILGSSTPKLSKCQCLKQLGQTNPTEETAERVDEEEPKDTKESPTRPDGKPQNQAKRGDCRSLTFGRPKPYKDPSGAPDTMRNTPPNRISQQGTSTTKANVLLAASKHQYDRQMRDLDGDGVKPQMGEDKEAEDGGESDACSSASAPMDEQAPLVSAEAPMDAEDGQMTSGAREIFQTALSDSGDEDDSRRDKPFPPLKKLKIYRHLIVPSSRQAPDGALDKKADGSAHDTSASNSRTVELALFGTQDKSPSSGGQRSQSSSPNTEPDDGVKPPEIVSVNLSPLKRKRSEIAVNYSVKQRIHEKWSLPPAKIGLGHKLKIPKITFVPITGKKAERSSPGKKKEVSEAFEVKAVRQEHDGERERGKAEERSHAVLTLQENNVLRFRLINTFSSKDVSARMSEPADSTSEKPDLVDGKDRRERGSDHVPKSPGLCYEC